MAATFQQILSDVKAGRFEPVYLLGGEEPFHLDLLEEAIRKHAVATEERDFNETILYGRDANLAQIIGAAKQFPMMAPRRLVMVKEAQELREWRSKEKLEVLAKYAEKPVPSTVLVFVHRNKMPDKRLGAVKKLASNGVVYHAQKIKDYKLPEWIEQFVSARNRRIGPRMARMLAEYLGNDLKKVAGELDKLFIALPEGGEIDDVLIEQHIGISKEYNVFELTGALASKDIGRVMRIAQYMRANPKLHPVPMVLPILTLYFSRLLAFHHLPDKSQPAAAKALKVHPYAMKEYAMAARNYPPAKLARIFGYIRTCDKKSKGIDNTATNPYDLLQEVLFKTLH
jgi:DNA polymerase-3 subunit delta